MIRPIAIGLAPNLEIDDIVLAFKNIILGKIFDNSNEELFKLATWFKKNLKQESIFLFNSGRSALFTALSSIGLGSGDEVIVQAFTCVAVPNAVIWSGAKPVFVDITKENLGIDLKDLEKKISKNTKAIIVQHTFGIPAKIEEILIIAKKYNLCVIEDCAHCMRVKYKEKFLGSYSDFSVYSFGRDKAVSSVFGGALSVNNKKYIDKVNQIYANIPYPSKLWVFKQHFHSILMGVVLPLYNFLKIGKLILYFFQQANLLTFPVYREEKFAEKPKDFPKKLAASLAILAFSQLKKIDRFNLTRKNFVSKYNKLFSKNRIKTNSYPLLRYPLLIGERDLILEKGKRERITLGNWYSNVVDPKGVDFEKINYSYCPTAEYVAQYIINLPTYPNLTEKDYNKVISLFKRETLTFK